MVYFFVIFYGNHTVIKQFIKSRGFFLVVVHFFSPNLFLSMSLLSLSFCVVGSRSVEMRFKVIIQGISAVEGIHVGAAIGLVGEIEFLHLILDQFLLLIGKAFENSHKRSMAPFGAHYLPDQLPAS